MKLSSSKAGKRTLDARFAFAEVSFSGAPGGWTSLLRPAVGVEDGEQYLIRLFRKTKSPIDADLKDLVGRGLRRIRRVLSSTQARDVLVEAIEIVEDDDEIGILMLDPGSPLQASVQRRRARQSQYLVSSDRQVFWRNMVRIARGLALCHDANIVHGAVSAHTIFSQGDDRGDYRLGGYETCAHIADSGLAGASPMLQSSGAISFRQDWIDLGRTASDLLGTETEHAPVLLSIERRMLDRLTNPPHFQLYDGEVVLGELAEVVEELEKVGASADGELVLYPSRQALQSDLPTLTSGTIAASDVDAVLRFIENDLHGPTTRVAVADSETIARIVTDLALYTVEIVDAKVGRIRDAHKRRPNDWSVYDAVDLVQRVHLSRDRAGSNDRVLRLGPAAKRWVDSTGHALASDALKDSPVWLALLLLEAFSLLREQFRIYPVEVLPAPTREKGTIWVVPTKDPNLDQRRKTAGFKPAAESLDHELANDDGRANWTFSRTDALSGDRERSSQLNFEGTELIGGKKAYVFTSGDVLVPDFCHYLRPRRDTGFENAVRRRLQNIVAARPNFELLRLLDDPAQVAIDDALKEIAAPGPVPKGMDKTKAEAWNAIREGRSVNVIVGPPGVGKTYLISNLVKSILSAASDARILIAAQNHDTLLHMEEELNKELQGLSHIVVRIERSQTDEDDRLLRKRSRDLLQSVAPPDTVLMSSQIRQIEYGLNPVDAAQQAVGERVHRDTENLLVRSSDITLATTSSHVIEDMIADGEQFDWTIVEEAARANGAEMIGALLLGNRRVMIGDHKQLSPFDHAERQKMYDPVRAAELLRNARSKLAAINDLPPEVDVGLQRVNDDSDLLQNVLAIAVRMEEPFRSIAEREADRQKATGRASRFVNTLTEQNRMHPAIGEIVSNTFYGGDLISSDRVVQRPAAVSSHGMVPNSPIVVLNLPPLSKVDRPAFEARYGRSLRNDVEATVLVDALQHLRPISREDGRTPTLAVLSPYKAQVDHLKRLIGRQMNDPSGTLSGFESPRGDGNFVFAGDSFQGSEADVVLASLVRNNVLVGSRALGFMRNPQRVNVLLSRARHKLVLVTSLDFIGDAVDGADPDRLGGELGFLRSLIDELHRLTRVREIERSARIVNLDSNGAVKR